MPQRTVAQTQYEYAEAMLMVSELLGENEPWEDSDDEDDLSWGLDDGLSDIDDDDEFDDDDRSKGGDTDIAELLQILGLTFLDMAKLLEPDATRGPYGQTRKPSDFFECCLKVSDRDFCHIFRYYICVVIRDVLRYVIG